eukprot:14497139-Alexandrium_andersonii.AAC.1
MPRGARGACGPACWPEQTPHSLPKAAKPAPSSFRLGPRGCQQAGRRGGGDYATGASSISAPATLCSRSARSQSPVSARTQWRRPESPALRFYSAALCSHDVQKFRCLPAPCSPQVVASAPLRKRTIGARPLGPAIRTPHRTPSEPMRSDPPACRLQPFRWG